MLYAADPARRRSLSWPILPNTKNLTWRIRPGIESLRGRSGPASNPSVADSVRHLFLTKPIRPGIGSLPGRSGPAAVAYEANPVQLPFLTWPILPGISSLPGRCGPGSVACNADSARRPFLTRRKGPASVLYLVSLGAGAGPASNPSAAYPHASNLYTADPPWHRSLMWPIRAGTES